jgi:SagB-type dehydrogenase family enzyme
MWKRALPIVVVVAILSGMALSGTMARSQEDTMRALPEPHRDGRVSVERALAERRSVRRFRADELTRAELAQLAWAAQGVSSAEGLRTAPSAGATYPLELHVATSEGLFHYVPRAHALERRASEDVRGALERAAHGQDAISSAPAVFLFAAVVGRTEERYGRRAERYVFMEAGHAAQNLLLQATALGLAGVPMGAFEDDAVHRAARLASEERPLYLVPIGHR